jgi:hypothetical protein
MKSPKLCETKKLHYGEYLYKLVLSNQLNSIFRTELQKHTKLGFAKEQLNNLHEKYIQGKPLEKQVYRTARTVPVDEYLDALDIYSVLKFADSYKLRVDPWRSLTIYSNDRELLEKIIKKMRVSNRELWEPDNSLINTLLNEKNIILVDNPPDMPIKVTLGNKSVDPSFAKWLRSNADKSRIGPIAIQTIEDGGYLNGLYFYLRDEKLLNLVNMIIGHNIRRIDKLVYKENIDK